MGGTQDRFLLPMGFLAPVGELDPILPKDRNNLIEKCLDVSWMVRSELKSVLWGKQMQGKKGDSNP